MIADDASGLNLFPTGATYWYTDYAKGVTIGDAYASSGTVAEGATDRTIKTVNNLSTNKGTADNPYVINSKDDWNDFVTFTNTAANQSLTYVLNCDLDYLVPANDTTPAANGAIKSILNFSGKFYGNGHKISNAKYTNTTTNVLNSQWMGLFCRVTGAAAFADLTLENLEVAGGAASHVGGLVGHSEADLTVTGVVVTGKFTVANPENGNVTNVCTASGLPAFGGIAGSAHGSGKKINAYKCATDVSMTIDNSKKGYIGAGGMFGVIEQWAVAATIGQLNIYDCFSSLNLNYKCYTGSLQLWTGVVGFLRHVSLTTIKRCLSVCDVTSNSDVNLSPGIFFTVGENTHTGGKAFTNNYVVDSCYGYGNMHLGTTHKALPFIGKYQLTVTSYTFTNCKLYSDYMANGYWTNSTSSTGIAAMNTEPHKGAVSSLADLKEAATGVKVTRDSDGNIISKTVTNAKAPLGNTMTWMPNTVEEISSPMILPDIVGTPILSMIVVPQDTEVVYTGDNISFAGVPWFAESVHGNKDLVTYTTSGMVNAGTYTVTFNLKSGLTWNDGTKGSKSIEVKVNPRKLTIDWDESSGVATPKITGGLANRDISNPPAIDVTYYKDGAPIDGYPETVGTYTVKATIAAGGNYKLKDEGEDDPSHTFYLAAVPIKTPTVSGGREKYYDGTEQTFLLMNCEPIENGKVYDLSQAKMPAGATYDYDENTHERTITVKDAGTYPIRFTLTDQTNTCWADGSGILNLVVKKKEIDFIIEREGSWEEFQTNTQEKITITTVGAANGDNIAIDISYVRPDQENDPVTVGNDRIKTEKNSDGQTVYTVTLDRLDRGWHTLRVGLAGASSSNANKNYYTESAVKEQQFKVVGKQIDAEELASVIEWQYSDGRETKPLTPGLGIDYNGRTITVSIKTAPLAEQGVRIDSYENQTAVNVTPAGTPYYTTRVLLKKLNDTYEFEDTWFSINWSILKAIIDLTNVEWAYEGMIGYTGNMISVRLKNVPDMLVATYGTGSQWKNVTDVENLTAEVSFRLKNSTDANNYEIPSGKVSSGTYKYNKTDNNGDPLESFPWTLKWGIKKGTIAMNWDLQGGYTTDKNGVGFTYPVLLSGGNYINYEFYKTQYNSSTGKYETVGDAVPLENILVTPNDPKPYCVKVVLKAEAADNFELGTEGDNPKNFTIGDARTAITVTVTAGDRMYSGKPQTIDFELVNASEHVLSKENNDFEITYIDGNGIMLDGAPVNVGKYTAIISVREKGQNAQNYYVANSQHKFEVKPFTLKASDLKWDYDPNNPFVFTRVWDAESETYVEKVYTVKLAGVPDTLNLVYTNNRFSVAGNYSGTNAARVQFDETLIDSEVLPNLDIASIRNVFATQVPPLNWEIQKRELTAPNSFIDPLTYDGSPNDLIALLGLDSDWEQYLNISVKKDAAAFALEDARRAKNAGTYSLTCSILGSVLSSVVWKGGNAMAKEVFIEISPSRITVTGWQGKPAQPRFKDGGSESVDVIYKLEDGTVIPLEQILAKKYLEVKIYATVEPKSDMVDNVWIVYDENVEPTCMFIMFQGGPTAVKFPTLVVNKLFYNFANQEFEIEDWDSYYNGKVTVLGANGTDSPLKVDGKFIGKRIIKIALRGDKNVEWEDHTTNIYELTIEVVRGNITQEWELDDKGRPVLSFADMDAEFDIASIVEYKYRDMNGILVTNLKEGVKYKAIATIKSAYADYFCFGYNDEDETDPKAASDAFEFTFGVNEPPSEPDVPKDDDVYKPGEDTLNLPLWQLIVGGVSAVLFVFCTLKAFGEYGKLKTAKKEAKDLAAQSYATTYGFAPLGLLAVEVGLWGMGESAWTIIAFAALGLFLLSAVALFLLGKKRKAAELVVKREQARIAEEKEFAREEERREEQQRRDNEMKMMFAAMQQNYQPQPYEDVRGLIAETMQAFLPMMQQQMALPPAQSDPNAYAAPQQPNYGAQPNYGGQSETEQLLREQMARQEERMARQEELISQLLQNQAAQQSAPAEYEDDVQDDVSWLGESDEVVSLEESYGALSDEAKRAYYEIGSYIMSKPRTSQNDGRYAVLFKYRRRTLFKLCIKDDAPVLYYPEGVGRGEIRIGDAAALGLARSVIDRNVARVDSELN